MATQLGCVSSFLVGEGRVVIPLSFAPNSAGAEVGQAGLVVCRSAVVLCHAEEEACGMLMAFQVGCWCSAGKFPGIRKVGPTRASPHWQPGAGDNGPLRKKIRDREKKKKIGE